MKSASVLVGLLASVGAAQPHANHRNIHRRLAVEKRGHGGGVATEWVTHWETATWVEEIGQSATKFYPYTPSGGAWPPPSPAPADADSDDEAQPQPQPSSTSTSSAVPTAPSVAEQPPSSHAAPAADTTSSPPPNVLVVPTPTVPHTTFVSSTTAPSVAAPSAGGSSGSTGGYQFTGDLTFYTLGMGSCGIDNTNDDNSKHIVAVPIGQMSAWTGNPNNNPNCGRTVEISYGGKTATAMVADTCGGCADGALDCSMSLFLEFGVEADGRLHGMQWKYIN